ncbi:Lrp/AsnC family transcriptional regulator [Gordonia sp. CPCC 205515]|uniref:Lrp/AsnC family transcriptional regulator n=1 Tax=Gordonia sp. CPCC 205515 TaxID=3140791 RepID=UPI003AF3F965
MQNSGQERAAETPITLSDDDHLLVAALQETPRAPWTDIGARLGVSGTTAARRWNRLRSHGVAWVAAYPARMVPVTAFCWVTTTPAARRPVGVALAGHSSSYWVERLDGDRTYFAGFGATSMRAMDAVVDDLCAIPGVTDVQMQFTRSVLHDGTIWQPRLAGPVDQDHPLVWSPREPVVATPSASDLALFRVLVLDARASNLELAEASGLSERTVRRRLEEMFGPGGLTTRCDVSREAIGMGTSFFLSVRWTARWQTLLGVANRDPGARLVAGVSGSAPFLLHFWARSAAEMDAVIGRLQAVVPDLEIERIDVAVRALKRFGFYFDPHGRIAGTTFDDPAHDFFGAALGRVAAET